jgi:hypothetical protein
VINGSQIFEDKHFMYLLKIEEMDTVRLYGQQTLNFLNGNGFVPQIVLTIIIVIVISTLISMFEVIVTTVQDYNKLMVNLYPYSYTADTQQVYIQDPANGEFQYMYPSTNEFNGIEFSFSFNLYIDPKTYENTPAPIVNKTQFLNVFYKGDQNTIWPNMSPGVFLNANENTIRVYVSSITGVRDSYVEIPNVPVGKWFHMVIVQKGQNMDVYINGNVAVRKTFTTVPKFNFGPVVLFANKTFNASKTDTTMKASYQGSDGNMFAVVGKMQGMISKLKYYAYAVSFSQIDSLALEGPSNKIITKSLDQTPPYFHDSWWVTRYNTSSANYGL